MPRATFRGRCRHPGALVGGVPVGPLNELIRLSVEHNPSLQAAEAAIRIANFNALAQRGLFFPQIGVNFTPSDQQSPK